MEVYPNKSPPLGFELNRPCVVTFFKYIDLNKSTLPYPKALKLLKRKSKKLGVRLISFDAISGEVKVGIDHFTKYSMNILDEIEP